MDERDRLEAMSILRAYEKLADRMGPELFDLIETSNDFELLS